MMPRHACGGAETDWEPEHCDGAGALHDGRGGCGLLYIKVLRSPHAHARIVEIDRAKALP